MNVIEKFMQLLLEKEDESQLSPIFQHGDVAFVYIKYNNVYRMCSKMFFLHKNFIENFSCLKLFVQQKSMRMLLWFYRFSTNVFVFFVNISKN